MTYWTSSGILVNITYASKKESSLKSNSELKKTSSIYYFYITGQRVTRLMKISELINYNNANPIYPCQQCTSVFKSKDLLRRHQMGVHIQTDSCLVCKRPLKYRGSFKIHVGRSDNLRRHLFKCTALQSTLRELSSEDGKHLIDVHVRQMMKAVKQKNVL